MFGYFLFQPVKKQCCPRAEDRTFSRTCGAQGQGQGLELRCQGQGLQNVFSKTATLIVTVTGFVIFSVQTYRMLQNVQT